ncbi:MAG: hypothetical protein RL215_232 [Planctomycetota bacterium]
MIGVVDFGGESEAADGFGEEVSVVGDGDFFGDFGFWFFGGVDDMGFMFHERPFEAFFGAVDIEAFAVLAGDIVEESPDMGGEVGVANFDMAGFDGEAVAGFLGDVIADGAGAEAADVFGESVDESQAGAHDVCGVVHGDHFFPVAGPAVHVLWV